MFKNTNQISETVRCGFHKRRVLVVGDLMLDRYLWGQVERISPEAPVPVVRVDHKSHVAGGAANVAANLSALGCAVSVVGLLGTDEEGRHLLDLLQSLGIETTGILTTPDRPTTSKTRIVGGRQQMLRLDVERGSALNSELTQQVLAGVEAHISGSTAIVLSDYGKGLLNEPVCQTTIGRARTLGLPVFIGPKGLNYERYRGCELVSPNRIELAAATSTDPADLDVLLQKGERLRATLGVRRLVVTLGELGIALLDPTGVHRFPALAREVFDVSGAGDTVLATIAAGLAAGLDLHDALRLANLAAGIVIGKVGTVPISREELMGGLASDRDLHQPEKVCSRETLLQRVVQWRLAGQRIVFTNGCFDLFHTGHLALLEQAKREGDRLVVALNTDCSVRALKGPGRPIVSEDARAKLVAALPHVDAVVLFNEETPLSLIRAVRPHVLVKGGDYTEDEVVGGHDTRSWGGKVRLIPFVDGSSTTAILKKAMASVAADSTGLIQ